MHRVSIASLMELNGLSSPDDIYMSVWCLQIPGYGMMGNSQNAQETDQAAAPPAGHSKQAPPAGHNKLQRHRLRHSKRLPAGWTSKSQRHRQKHRKAL